MARVPPDRHCRTTPFDGGCRRPQRSRHRPNVNQRGRTATSDVPYAPCAADDRIPNGLTPYRSRARSLGHRQHGGAARVTEQPEGLPTADGLPQWRAARRPDRHHPRVLDDDRLARQHALAVHRDDVHADQGHDRCEKVHDSKIGPGPPSGPMAAGARESRESGCRTDSPRFGRPANESV